VYIVQVNDPIKDHFTKPSARICGATWAALFAAANVTAEDIWPGVPNPGRTIWTAKLFPVFEAVQIGHEDDSSPPETVQVIAARASCGSVHDRATLWLQYLAYAHELPSKTSLGAALPTLIKAHLHEDVTSAWRNAPRVSLKDILGQADASLEFAWRRTLRGKIDVSLLLSCVSQRSDVSVAELADRLGRAARTVTSVTDGAGTALDDVAGSHLSAGKPRASRRTSSAPPVPTNGNRILAAGVGQPDYYALDGDAKRVALPSPVMSVKPTSGIDAFSFAYQTLRGLDLLASKASPDVAGRALAVQSALLWAMAGWGKHEHRSGPAHNAEWLPAFALLEGDYAQSVVTTGTVAHDWNNNRAKGVGMLADLRDTWLHRAHLIGRAARHYERAAQLVTAQCVYTAPVSHPVPAAASLPVNTWATVSAPARIDLAGGWSDTPPITYEANVPLKPSGSSSKGGKSGYATVRQEKGARILVYHANWRIRHAYDVYDGVQASATCI
jgi:hypothetical protein